ncbi:MAG TPA: cation diffusion facilitator family transporter [Chloroflexia bacterium]|nr:cation diffusion facilitator family transporter [Chloroflexia bacterium]
MAEQAINEAEHPHPQIATTSERPARSFVLLSFVAAVLTIGLKFGAYLLTGSVGLLSDATESVINLIAAGVAFWMLTVASRPPDEEHAFGHSKAEYFSSGVESSLILVAAAGIAWAAWGRLFSPQPLENVGLGSVVSLVATGINGGVAVVLLRAGRRLRSITLTAGGQHLLTDVWTSLGVLAAVVLVQLTGWFVLDPIVAFAVAANIVWIAARLMNDSAHGLLDTAMPPPDQEIIADILSKYKAEQVEFHALRTRVAGQRRFISMHVLVPGKWSVQRGHALCEQIERDLTQTLPKSSVFTHLEPKDDPSSWDDVELDRLWREQ